MKYWQLLYKFTQIHLIRVIYKGFGNLGADKSITKIVTKRLDI